MRSSTSLMVSSWPRRRNMPELVRMLVARALASGVKGGDARRGHVTHSLSKLLPETLSTTEDLVNSGRACAARERVTARAGARSQVVPAR